MSGGHRQPLEQLARRVRDKLSSDITGHDFWHVTRVRNLALAIAGEEGGDLEVVEAAALLHDVFRPEEHARGILHIGQEAQAYMRDLLVIVGFPREKIPAVLYCIEVHEHYAFAGDPEAERIEARILQDADRLDAMGAIGIARALMFSGAHGLTLWDPEERPGAWSAHRPPQRSSIIHFQEKLLKLESTMHTATARRMARERHAFMELFLRRFFAEWHEHGEPQDE
ncbi:MAG TPA: HD domain-containing protein [bacterium]|nr:HD domain-containing protein [bacterium]